jgi:HSP20 family protein
MSSSPFHGIFQSLARGSVPREQEDVVQPRTAGQVAVDIYEVENYVIIKAPIAGVRLCDLDIEVEGNVVILRGTRRQTDDIPEDAYDLRECYWGPFERRVTLPFEVDPRKIKATFNKESILKILIPREEKVKVVKISEI